MTTTIHPRYCAHEDPAVTPSGFTAPAFFWRLRAADRPARLIASTAVSAGGPIRRLCVRRCGEVLSRRYLQAVPTWATYLGIHKYDDWLEDSSGQAAEAITSARQFRERVAAIDPQRLSASNTSITSSSCARSTRACSRSRSSGRGRQTPTVTAAA